MNKYNIFKFLERNNKIGDSKWYQKIFNFILAPVYFILESFCKRTIWKNRILNELITNEPVFEFLRISEFGYRNGTFRKIELLSSNEYYDSNDIKNFKKIKDRIKHDYIIIFNDLFSANVPFDIENYLTLIVNVDIMTIKNEDEYLRAPIYEVILRYCRKLHYIKSRNLFIIWITFFTILFGIIVWLL